jgi:AcrR family transcriptional regulator
MNDEYLQTGRINQKLETRDKILASAQFFLNKGMDFNLDDIAREAGISRATVYRYYSNAELLACEASLAISTQSPQTICDNLQDLDTEDVLLGIQEYFNHLSIDHENAFRKYLSFAISADNTAIRRGARRIKTLKLALKDSTLKARDKNDLANLLTVLMGIEPIIVAKDVCGLNNKQSLELLKWGMEMILKGIALDKG